MTTLTEFRKNFTKKFLQSQLDGMKPYSKYLDQQLKLAEKMKYGAAYKRYIEQQIVSTEKKIKTIQAKISSIK